MATTTSTTLFPWGDAIGDFRINRVLDDFSILKGGHFGYRIELTAWKAALPPARSRPSTPKRSFAPTSSPSP